MGYLRLLILILLGIWTTGTSSGQEFVSKSDVEDPIIQLLEQYIVKLGNIEASDPSGSTKDFLAIFSNPNVRVINNLYADSAQQSLSVMNYCNKLIELYPEGMTVGFSDKTIKIGKARQSLGNRYLIPVKVHLKMTAYYEGKVYEHSQDVSFTIAFNWDGNSAGLFQIYGISLPKSYPQEIWVTTAFSGSRVTGPWIKQDDRFTNKVQAASSINLMYLVWINSKLGLGAGIRTSFAQSCLELNSFNPLQGRDPNFNQVSFNTSLYQYEFPIKLYSKTNWKGRFNLIAGAGLYWSQRMWLSTVSSAVNTNYDIRKTDVISDSQWMNRIRKSFIGAEVQAGVRMKLSRNINLLLDANYSQALSALDKMDDAQFSTQRYLGKYNPLWMDPESRNYLQIMSVRLSVIMSINSLE
ncbi:MAG: hypothetical protein HOK84_02615 [Bacteroidetes bacterium]|jgi:hypothetical protein|nr:hypothetical protein [Bacteroidota bacterium]MBT4400450.1 hypothetical protein [Bacteroidota bacterium]MBT4410348.1 hypothetical protein [Bacteroidota bacterium]MBT5425056.1 hypothetical protein [Bacteroidota bacterium]MBT7464810.1 hypothetical protein [Bacteroidota bacterium]